MLATGIARAVTDSDEKARLAQLPLSPWAGGCRESFVTVPISFVSGQRILPGITDVD